jgi:FMN-dependent NADH-azoreductase
MKLLHIDSSILGTQSASRELSAAWAANWKTRHPESAVAYRDLAAQPLPHLTADVVMARSAPHAVDDAELRSRLDADEAMMQEFLDADVIVIGAPMYNFSVPSQLKAWIDRIAVAGRTFSYGPKGPQGLAGGKKVVVISSRGGVYSTGPAAAFDHQESYLRAVFGFLGIDDVEFIRAEGLNMGADQRTASMSDAHARIAPMKIAA